MKLSKHITFLFFFFFLIINKTQASIPFQCYDFVEKYKNLKFEKSNTQIPTDKFTDFGFSFSYVPSVTADLTSTEFTSKIYRINNYPVITYISTYNSHELFNDGDILISIDGDDTRNMSDKRIKDLVFYPDDQFYELVVMRGDQKIKRRIKPEKYEVSYYGLDFGLEQINKIDVINSTVIFTAFIASNLYYYESTFPQIVNLAKDTIAPLSDDGIRGSIPCLGLDQDFTKENRIPNPIDIITFENLIEENQNLVNDSIDIQVFKNKDELDVSFMGTSVGTWEIKNNFNLSSFPFDKQKITISILSEDIRNSIIEYNDTSYRLVDVSFEQLSIPGWDVKNIELKNSNLKMKDLLFSKLIYEIQIERQYFYYIFKIILPIILILSICWSSVWLNRKEVESKLTITIVCLLSLIAYNFVIDNEIPKLNYLTIMDWIILLSYIYAAIPNILAIITYQFGLNTKYKKFNFTIDNYSKKFGIGSYILLVLLIIIINVSNVPDNTIDSLSWAMVK